MPRHIAVHASALTSRPLAWWTPLVVAALLATSGCAGSAAPHGRHHSSSDGATTTAGETCPATESRGVDPAVLSVGDVWPHSTNNGHVYTSLSPHGCGSGAAPMARFCAWLTGTDPPAAGKSLLASLGVSTMQGARLVDRDGSELTEVLLTLPSADAAQRIAARSQTCLGVSPTAAVSADDAGRWTTVRVLDNRVVTLSATGVPPERAHALAVTALNRSSS